MTADGTLEKLDAKMKERMAAKGGGKGDRSISERMKAETNPLVAKAFADAQPKDFDEAVETYAQLFASLSAKAKALIPAMRNATSQAVPDYDAALIELIRGPFQIVPAPLANQDWLENATRDLPKKLANRVGLNFSGINLLETSHPGAPGHAMVVMDKPVPVNSPILIRGQALVKGDIVPRGFLEILSPGHKPIEFSEGSGRMELAKCIASRDNPLTARVIVNRVWMHHFGEGIVTTSDDLGTMAEKPTHPELLDYLATWFMDNGWSLKKLHKFIVLSRIYRVTSHRFADYETLDPGNRLLSRANIRRLDFEASRDSLLVYSGALDRTLGGKPINLTDEPYSFRRSVYGYIDRGNLSDLMANFDFSDPDMPNSKRATTIVPQQALFLMNSPMAADVARKIFARPEVARQSSDLDRITAIYRVIFQRNPSLREIELALQFVQTETRKQEECVGALKTRATAASESDGDKAGSKAMKRKEDRFGAIQNEGPAVIRTVLSPWETYVHALLSCNEAAYVN